MFLYDIVFITLSINFYSHSYKNYDDFYNYNYFHRTPSNLVSILTVTIIKVYATNEVEIYAESMLGYHSSVII